MEREKKKKGLVDNSSVTYFVKTSDSNTKLATLATNTELKANEDKIVKLQVFDSTYFRDKSDFENNGMQD